MKLIYYEPLSQFAFNVNLRRYNMAGAAATMAGLAVAGKTKVGGCRLTPRLTQG